MNTSSLKYQGLGNRKRVLLHHDNATPHTAKVKRDKIGGLGGIELLPHPAFSRDLAPSDYYLFRSMAKFFSGKDFEFKEDFENALRQFFVFKLKDGFNVISESPRALVCGLNSDCWNQHFHVIFKKTVCSSSLVLGCSLLKKNYMIIDSTPFKRFTSSMEAPSRITLLLLA
ncbi:Histone-lysine N-methyltransferase SETMAR [Eumeta japonica]|uniref:Histone-lysine N-methyltransferase SETMAR n=1 Tax=Eumeta variegata TaxID=151549 RepID=A0A4C1TNE1_EUMVA|nr:Histone-lysine N-methyltransferase SETMAR [Eumeta japonica]